jgi:Protein of unknown function with HXXEE motif
MNSKIKSVFLILVLIQAMHSIEEYVGKLWEVFPPAAFLTSLFSNNLETGFLIVNIGLFVFGMLCWLFPIRRNYSAAKRILWFWIILETTNGIGHLIWSIYQQSYTPGLITALFLFFTAIYLAKISISK